MTSVSRFGTDTSTAHVMCKQRIFRKYYYNPIFLITKTCCLVKLATAQMIKEIYSKSFFTGNMNTHLTFLRRTSFLAANPTVRQCCLTFASTLCLNIFYIFWVKISGRKSQICAFCGHRNQLPIYFHI